MILALLEHQGALKIHTEEGKKSVWDPIRQKWIILTPEEHVRQLLLQHLLINKIVSKGRISIEKEVEVLGMRKRFDMLIYNAALQAQLLVECKAPRVSIDQKVLDQISVYNYAIKAPYLLVTNGLTTKLIHINFEERKHLILDNFPLFN